MNRELLPTVLLAILFLAAGSAFGQETASLFPSADNTLYESETGELSNGGGEFLFAGRTANGQLRRALLRFDLSAIPAGSTITAVDLRLFMNKTRAGSVQLTAHDVAADWGEGPSDDVGEEGGGAAAENGDATWVHRRFDNQFWSTAGGDFSELAAASVAVDQSGPYTISSNETLVSIAQRWLDQPQFNFGVLLKTDAEDGTSATAKRFSSREGSTPPVLDVTYTTPTDSDSLVVSGLWFDPDLPGDGYNVVQADDSITVFFFGYSADGERLWLVSSTETVDVLLDSPIQFTMFQGGNGGRFDDPTLSGALLEWGTLTITFFDCTSGLFELSGVDGSKTAQLVQLVGVAGSEGQCAR